MKYRPEDGTWIVHPQANVLLELHKQMTPSQYDEQKQALKEFLCGYFSATTCDRKQGNSISPMKATDAGGKVLKVRWGLPGHGKSGGLRLVVVAYCDNRQVFIAEASHRKDGLSAEQVDASVKDLP